ncbi:MAG: glycosyltransferase [bacterium]|nr:glycosyltransferase [bacterium]
MFFTSTKKNNLNHSAEPKLPVVLVLSSYPPRECGIATYSHDLIQALNSKFDRSFEIQVCALEAKNERHIYSDEVQFVMDTSYKGAYLPLAECINKNDDIEMVLVQHEFGFFHFQERAFIQFLTALNKPIIMAFHTVLPNPDEAFKRMVNQMVSACKSIVVMTKNSSEILVSDYGVSQSKIAIIPHGTHLVEPINKLELKTKFNVIGRKIVSTFGLLNSGKGIETTLEAMVNIVKVHPNALFLIIGKTHPNVLKTEGEKYRLLLSGMVAELNLQNHVLFVNQYLPLAELLNYLQLTDIYLFTSKDRNQAVSGTFSYAISCGCPIISTPIPHAREVLGQDAGIIVDFENASQLSRAVNMLLINEGLREDMRMNGLHKIVSTAWENSALSHALLFAGLSKRGITLNYKLPEINLNHFHRLTTHVGMIQFSKIGTPDLSSGYTLDDNARALIAICMHFETTKDAKDLNLIRKYIGFIKFCLQPGGSFLNYVNSDLQFTSQNYETNLEDSNGRAIWALGYIISQRNILPPNLSIDAIAIMEEAIKNIQLNHSPRAMAFTIKGLSYYYDGTKSPEIIANIKLLADRLLQMYKHESEVNWEWYENYLTYANSILPEAMLCAYKVCKDPLYLDIAKESFDFLLSILFKGNSIKVVSNRGWHIKGKATNQFGEQGIDVAYTILALHNFYQVFKDETYLTKMKIAFDWFLGNNHLHQIIYNPRTGGCYDGLEEHHINLNQGAESTVSYLLSRLTIAKYVPFATTMSEPKVALKQQVEDLVLMG